MHSYTEFLRDNTHERAVKHNTKQGLCCQRREGEGRSVKRPASSWEEGSGVFWKSLWGEKQINVEGELLETNVSAVTNESRPIRTFHLWSSLSLSESSLSDSLSCVVFFFYPPFPSNSSFFFFSQHLTVLFMCFSVLLNQSLAILPNAKTLLSLDGYSPILLLGDETRRLLPSSWFAGKKEVFFFGAKHFSSLVSISSITRK